MHRPSLRPAGAVVGSLVFAGAGATIGAMNAGWFGLERNANALLPVLGLGAALVVVAFARTAFPARLREAGGIGSAAQGLLVAAPVLLILGGAFGFAIFGTLALGFGLACLAVAVTLRRLVPAPERLLVIVSAVGSMTWNTETTSAFLLVGVGLIWAVLSVRLMPSGG